MGRQGTRRWSRKPNKQQKQQQKTKGPTTNAAQTTATITAKSASMALAGVKQGAMALVSGFARHCWGDWGMPKSPASTHVAHGQTRPPTPSSMPGSQAVRSDEEASMLPAAAAVEAPATTATEITATATLVPDSTATTTSVPLHAALAPVALCDTYDWKDWTADTKKQLQLLLLLGKRETLLMGLSLGTTVANMPPMYIQEVAELGGLHFAFISWAYMSRMSVSLALFVAASLLCALISTMAGWTTPNIQILDFYGQVTGSKTLPDRGHDLTGWVLRKLGYSTDYINVHHIPDTIAEILTSLTSLLLLLHPKRFMIIRRDFSIGGVIFIYRSITVFVTNMPDPSPKCQSQWGASTGAYKNMPMFPQAIFRAWKFAKDPSSHTTCGDMIFSGHTSVMMLCALTFWQYCRSKEMTKGAVFRNFHVPEWACGVARWCIYFLTAFGAMMVVATRLHYSIDVLLAIQYSTNIFWSYHLAIKHMKTVGGKGYFWKFLRWMEAEEVQAIDRQAASVAFVQLAHVDETIETHGTEKSGRANIKKNME